MWPEMLDEAPISSFWKKDPKDESPARAIGLSEGGQDIRKERPTANDR